MKREDIRLFSMCTPCDLVIDYEGKRLLGEKEMCPNCCVHMRIVTNLKLQGYVNAPGLQASQATFDLFLP